MTLEQVDMDYFQIFRVYLSRPWCHKFDLLADPYGEFGKMARKLGITSEEARIRRAVGHASFKKLQEMEQKTGFVERSISSEKFFRSGRSGAWKDELTPKQAKRIERDHREQMKRFGYL